MTHCAGTFRVFISPGKWESFKDYDLAIQREREVLRALYATQPKLPYTIALKAPQKRRVGS